MDILFSLVGIVAFYLLVAFVIWVIVTVITSLTKKGGTQQSIPQESLASPESIKEWLLQKKEEGYKTIDSLIDSFVVKAVEPAVVPEVEETEEVPSTPAFSSTLSITQESKQQTIIKKKGLIDSFSASVLLYLGAAFIIFAVFIFIAFTWDSYSNVSKSLLILGVTFGMYVAGIVFSISKRVRQAGHLFLFIASILVGFLGVGLWNFTFKDYLSIDFYWYWLGWSVVMIFMYGVTFYLLKLQRFYYFLLFAIYNLFFFVAYTVGGDTSLKAVLFLVLNLGVYLLSNTNTQSTKFTKTISRVINAVLNYVVFISVWVTANQLDTTLERVYGLIALIIPSVFAIAVFRKEKSSIESAIELLFFPLKVLIIANIFEFSAEATVFALFLYTTITTTLSELFKRWGDKVLSSFAKISTWLVTGGVFLYLLVLWFTQSSSSFDTNMQVLLIVGFGVLLILPEMYAKSKILLSVALLYPVFAVSRLLSIFYSEAAEFEYILVLSLLAFGFTSAVVYFHNKNQKVYSQIPLPAVLMSSIISIILALSVGESLESLIAFGSVSLVMIGLSSVYKAPWLIVLSVPLSLISYFNLVTVLDDNLSIALTADGRMGLLLLIPTFIYAFIFENKYFKKQKVYPYVFGFFAFLLSGYFAVLENDAYLFYYLGAFAVYGIYAFLKFRRIFAAYFVFAFMTFALWAGLDLLMLPDHTGILATLSLWLGFNVVGYLGNQYLSKKSIGNVFKQFTYIATALMTASFFTLFEDLPMTFNILYVLSGVVFFVSMLVSDKFSEFFGNISGLGLILAVWNIVGHYDLGTQFYIVPLTIYLSAIAIRYFLKQKKLTHELFKYSAVTLQFTSLLLQSIFESGDVKLLFGLVLIVLATLLLLVALAYKDYKLVYFSLAFIFVELFVRLYVIIVQIPWWMYLGLFGLGIMGLAVYILWKVGDKGK